MSPTQSWRQVTENFDCGRRGNRRNQSTLCSARATEPLARENGKSSESYLLELLDGTLVDTTALVDQVTGLRGS